MSNQTNDCKTDLVFLERSILFSYYISALRRKHYLGKAFLWWGVQPSFTKSPGPSNFKFGLVSKNLIFTVVIEKL